ncbi:MFS transporter [Williamsia sp.]|uniref:MFS transporter n=1 Tax=Williamsia sp. TaxID=1872085 RepID=UPI001A3478D3|nr:MFS transporter [Williamsia sp.]MBJ7288023.1 MFS transporter [Williamsia sp.]
MTDATSTRPDTTRAPQTAGLMAVLALVMVGTTMPTSIYATYERELHFSLLTVTVIYATYAVGVLATLLAFGKWSDALGRRPLLFAGIGFAALSDVVFLLADNTALLLVGRLISGMSAGIFVGTASVAIIEMARGRLSKRAPLFASMSNIGGLGLGPILAAVVVTVAPAPTRTSYWVHLGLMVVAALIVTVVPETRSRHRDEPLRPMPLSVPADIRTYFIRASLLGFAGFAVLGLFTAVAPTIATQIAGVDSLIGTAFLVATTFGGSIIGQIAARTLTSRVADPLSIALFVLGMVLLILTLIVGQWPLLAVAGVVGGLGQGIAFSKGLAGVTAAAPADDKAGITSAYFVIAYIGISVPVVAEGLLSRAVGVETAGIIFASVIIVLALLAGALTAFERRRSAAVESDREPAAH